MNGFLLWHRDPQARLGIASDRRVLRATEVPALQEAQQLLDELRTLHAQEHERVAAACAQGHAQGLQQGLADAADQARAHLADALAQQTRAHEQARQQLQQDLATLALEVFRKLLGELPAEQRLARLAAQAARELLPARTWRLHVHPTQLTALRAALAALDPADKAGLARAEIVADAELAEGDCRLTTEFGTADAGLDAQLQRLARAWSLA